MTVATLFVNMTFDALLHPPEWMKITEFHLPKPSLFHSSRVKYNTSIYLYLYFNTLTFATSLVLVLVLLRNTASAKHTLNVASFLVYAAAGCLAFTCGLGISGDWVVRGYMWLFCVTYAFLTLYSLFIWRRSTLLWQCLKKLIKQTKVKASEEAKRGKKNPTKENNV